MSSSVLEKLKAKPVLEKIEDFQFKFKIKQDESNDSNDINESIVPNDQNINIQEPVNIKSKPKPRNKTKITDKTKENLINRDDFIKKLNLTVYNKITDENSLKDKDKNNNTSKLIPQQLSEQITDKIETDTLPKPPPKKIKKIPKKLKLVDETSVKTNKPRKTEKPNIQVIADNIDLNEVIGQTSLKSRLPEKENKVIVRANAYYMNNREVFINFINALFKPYKEEFQNVESNISCDRPQNAKFDLLIHQKIVRDYLNLYTPYRGLLLYHGLGSGKTCSSIAITEGMKSDKQVIIMTPKSLRMNYLQELQNCGDTMYKKNQFWEFIPIQQKNDDNLINTLSTILNIKPEFIRKHGGAWLVNVKKDPNYNDLSTQEKQLLDLQIIEMIHRKYNFINYNGLRETHLLNITNDYTINPFDNKVIVIDEAHNFVSRIVNKIRSNNTNSVSMKLYEYLLSAENCRIVLLTGTPMINYPNEIAVLFNILRGYIKTWSIPIKMKVGGSKLNKDVLVKIFEKFDILDHIDYKPRTEMLIVTKNPFGFINVNKNGLYKGVTNFKINNRGDINDSDFIKILTSILNKNDIELISSNIKVDTYKALDDKLDSFETRFIDTSTGNVKNANLLKKRIIGLSSYFRSAQEQLMPKYDKDVDFKVIKIPMSDYQFGVYEQARIQERNVARSAAKKKKKQANLDIYKDTTSSYRIFSRAFCNFVFPENRRPMPKDDNQTITSVIEKGTADEDILDAVSIKEKTSNIDGLYELDDAENLENKAKNERSNDYAERIEREMKYLEDNADKFLTPNGLQIYSPKFLNLLENLKDAEFRGLHLIYTQFRTIEGIGVLKLILDANGFTQFKIKKNNADIWVLDIPQDKKGLPTYALYTGTESDEEKEIIRNIYNSKWHNVPDSITIELSRQSTNNFYGEIIKILMITASGAEGIDLKNTRYVHLIEPYWHPVRTEQVIGRARRICSHQDLPPQFRTVNVFLYLMTFTNEQLSGDGAIELKLKDGGKLNPDIPFTSDETLYEISQIKEKINSQLLKCIKEAAIDCIIYNKPGTKDAVKCFSFGKSSPNSLSYNPSISNEQSDTISQLNRQATTLWVGEEVTLPINGVNTVFIRNPNTNEIYNLDSYNQSVEYKNPEFLINVGKLVKKTDGKFTFVRK